ncbi:MAG: hypothetical protein WBM66_17685 [Thiothrix litoralis]
MKTPQLALPLIALCISSGAAYAADSATATQTLSLTVPLVALIDVENINPSFTFEAPTNAGQGFTGSTTPLNNKPFIAISSNNNMAKLQAQTDVDLSVYNLQLEISDIDGFPTGFDKPLSNSPTTLTTIGMMKTSTAKIKLAARGTSTGTMIPYGSYPVQVTYTLTQN